MPCDDPATVADLRWGEPRAAARVDGRCARVAILPYPEREEAVQRVRAAAYRTGPLPAAAPVARNCACVAHSHASGCLPARAARAAGEGAPHP